MFGRFSDPKRPLYLASVKSNIGHLEGASGIVSVIKATLMLEKGFFLPNCDFEKSNPAIPFKDWNLKVLKISSLLISFTFYAYCDVGSNQVTCLAKQDSSHIYQ